MKIKLGALRRFIQEELVPRANGSSARTDPDAQTPGHLPDELPGSAALDVNEEAWPPGRGNPTGGVPLDGDVADRLGEPLGETDGFTMEDDLGNGEKDRNDPDSDDFKIAQHLRGDDEKLSLGDPPDNDVMKDQKEARELNAEIRAYLLQEYPVGAGMVDPTKDPKGFYTDFNMEKDHHTGADIQGVWYKSPGQAPGTAGDPFRVEDPHSRLGFHPPPHKDTTSHPAVSGEKGADALRAPGIWQLTGGSDTSQMLGPSVKGSSAEVPSEDGTEQKGKEGVEGEEGEGQEQS